MFRNSDYSCIDHRTSSNDVRSTTPTKDNRDRVTPLMGAYFIFVAISPIANSNFSGSAIYSVNGQRHRNELERGLSM